MMYTQYVVLEEWSIGRLALEVETKLKNGWTLIGGVAVNNTKYLQALAK